MSRLTFSRSNPDKGKSSSMLEQVVRRGRISGDDQWLNTTNRALRALNVSGGLKAKRTPGRQTPQISSKSAKRQTSKRDSPSSTDDEPVTPFKDGASSLKPTLSPEEYTFRWSSSDEESNRGDEVVMGPGASAVGDSGGTAASRYNGSSKKPKNDQQMQLEILARKFEQLESDYKAMVAYNARTPSSSANQVSPTLPSPDATFPEPFGVVLAAEGLAKPDEERARDLYSALSQMEESVLSYESVVQDLQASLAETRDERDTLQERVSTVERELERCSEASATFRSQSSSLIQEDLEGDPTDTVLENLKDRKLASQAKELEEIRIRESKLLDEREAIQTTLRLEVSEKETLRKEVEQVKSKLSTLSTVQGQASPEVETEVKTLRAALMDHVEQKEQAILQNEAQVEENERLKQELSALRANLQQEVLQKEATHTELETELQTAKEELTALKQRDHEQIRNLQAELAALKLKQASDRAIVASDRATEAAERSRLKDQEVEERKRERDRNGQVREALKAEVTSLQEQVKSLTQELSFSKAQPLNFHDAQSNEQALQSQVQSLKAQLASESAALRELRNKHDLLEQSFEAETQEKEELRDFLQTEESTEKELLIDEAETLRVELQTLGEESQSQRQTIHTLKQKLESARASAEGLFDERLQELTDQLSTVKKLMSTAQIENDSLVAETEDLRKQLAQRDAELTQVQEQKEDSMAEGKVLKRQLVLKEEEVKRVVEQNRDLAAGADALSKQLDAKTAELSELLRERAGQADEAQGLLDQKKQLSDRAEALQSDLHHVKLLLASSAEEVEGMKVEGASLKRQLSIRVEEAELLRAQVLEMKELKASETTRVRDLETENQILKAETEHLEAELATHTSPQVKLKEEEQRRLIEDLNRQYRQKSEEALALQDDKHKLTTDAESLNLQLHTLKTEVRALTEKSQRLQSQIFGSLSEFKAKLSSGVSTFTEHVTISVSCLEELQGELQELRQTYHAGRQEESTAARTLNEQHRAAIEQKEKLIIDLSAQAGQLHEEKQALENDLGALLCNVEVAKKEKEELQLQVEACSTENGELQKKIHETRAEAEAREIEIETELENAAVALERAHQEAQDRQARIDLLEAANSEAKMAIEHLRTRINDAPSKKQPDEPCPSEAETMASVGLHLAGPEAEHRKEILKLRTELEEQGNRVDQEKRKLQLQQETINALVTQGVYEILQENVLLISELHEHQEQLSCEMRASHHPCAESAMNSGEINETTSAQSVEHGDNATIGEEVLRRRADRATITELRQLVDSLTEDLELQKITAGNEHEKTRAIRIELEKARKTHEIQILNLTDSHNKALEELRQDTISLLRASAPDLDLDEHSGPNLELSKTIDFEQLIQTEKHLIGLLKRKLDDVQGELESQIFKTSESEAAYLEFKQLMEGMSSEYEMRQAELMPQEKATMPDNEMTHELIQLQQPEEIVANDLHDNGDPVSEGANTRSSVPETNQIITEGTTDDNQQNGLWQEITKSFGLKKGKDSNQNLEEKLRGLRPDITYPDGNDGKLLSAEDQQNTPAAASQFSPDFWQQLTAATPFFGQKKEGLFLHTQDDEQDMTRQELQSPHPTPAALTAKTATGSKTPESNSPRDFGSSYIVQGAQTDPTHPSRFKSSGSQELQVHVKEPKDKPVFAVLSHSGLGHAGANLVEDVFGNAKDAAKDLSSSLSNATTGLTSTFTGFLKQASPNLKMPLIQDTAEERGEAQPQKHESATTYQKGEAQAKQDTDTIPDISIYMVGIDAESSESTNLPQGA